MGESIPSLSDAEAARESESGRRGAARSTYANGDRTRAALITGALEVFAEQGYERLSLRRIAEALGTSHTVLRHHFGTKEHLLAAVLDRRDQDEAPTRESLVRDEGFLAAFPQIMAANARRRGIIGLDTYLRVEALDEGHPAHGPVRRQGRDFLAQVVDALTAEQRVGRLRDDVDPVALAPVVTAFVSGLQTAWLEDPEVDMAERARTFVELLRAQGGAESGA